MILAILQARMSSTRLPGKVMLPVEGEPMIARQIERIRRAATLDRLVVATSDHADDDGLAALCGRLGVDCVRGSLDDVLDRFHRAAALHRPEWVVRLTGDCPLIDWRVLDATVRHALNGSFDYVSNTLKPTWPDGLDVEVFRFVCLEEAWREAKLPSEREHVTPFIYKSPDRYRLGNYANDIDLSALRWTVDEPEDLEFVRRVYAALHPRVPDFGMADILDLLECHPGIAALNARFERNEGLKKSLVADQAFLQGKEAP